MFCQQCDLRLATCDNRGKCGCNGSVLHYERGSICDWCSYSEVVPDLSDEEAVSRWKVLEAAKRRLLYQLELLGLPPYSDVKPETPLRFQFLADYVDAEGESKRVFTGHQDGVITVNLQEGDSVLREKLRVELNEPQRTLIGHLRHEYGHYLDLCIPDSSRSEYIALFGDPNELNYADAKKQYYENGPSEDWRSHFVSAYSTMHPWEDFAESVNLYLDMQAIAITAKDSGWLWKETIPCELEIAELVQETLKVAVAVSELNSDLGLPALLPENIKAPVLAKLSFIHNLSLQHSASID